MALVSVIASTDVGIPVNGMAFLRRRRKQKNIAADTIALIIEEPIDCIEDSKEYFSVMIFRKSG